jgi:hypothetical protein
MLQLRYIPAKGINSHFFLPHPEQVPRGEGRGLTFPFGEVPALDTATFEIGLEEDFVVLAIHGVVQVGGFVLAPPPLRVGGLGGGFSLLFYHTHHGVQRQWHPQGLHYGLTCGTAAKPSFLRTPYLMEKGDTITAEIANITSGEVIIDGVVSFNYTPAAIYVGLDGVCPE